MKSQYILFHSATKNFFLNIFGSIFFAIIVPTRSQTCQFIGENSKYVLRKANAENVMELYIIMRKKGKLHISKLESVIWTFHPRITNRKEA